MPTMSIRDAEKRIADLLGRAGASQANAASLARAAIWAESCGQANVGIAHLADYIAAMRASRIDGQADPKLTFPAPTMVFSDARGGIAQRGFDEALPTLVETAEALGLALFSQHNAYTSGSLGYFASRLAERGLLALAATSGPALMAGSGGTSRVFCTNPIAFAAPAGPDGPLLIDQASSQTAFINIRKAAERDQPIPEGWALDAKGQPTTDPKEALKGALLAFGGSRGANMALMVEVLAAGLSSASWATRAADFQTGSESPDSGLFILAIDPAPLVSDFEKRLAEHLAHLENDHGVHIPGRAKAEKRRDALRAGIAVDPDVVERLTALTEGRTTT